MPKIKCFFVAIVLTFSFLTFVNAQQIPPSYGFVEVVDSQNKPVADASIYWGDCEKISNKQAYLIEKTNQDGLIGKGIRISGGSYRYPFSIYKDSYYPFIDYFRLFESLGNYLNNNKENPIKIELLKIPQNKKEKKLIGKEQLKREFFLAASRGDAATAQKFIKSGLSPNLTTSDLRGIPARKAIPIILFAIQSGNFTAVNEFLSAGVDIRKIPNILLLYLDADPYNGDYRNSEEITKAKKIYEDGFENLIEKGADVNARGKVDFGGDGLRDFTTLMIAAYKGYPKIVKVLIDKGVPIDATNDIGYTAVMQTLRSPYPLSITALEILLQAGANPNEVIKNNNSQCNSGLFYAGGEALKILIKYKADVNLSCGNRYTPIIAAASRGWSEDVKVLLEAGANVKGEEGHQALMAAKKNLSYCVEQTDYCKEVQKIVNLLEAAGAK